MGPLTEDMTRLCGEIVALRGARHTFIKDLTHQVAALTGNFHQARLDMARKSKADRRAFVRHLAQSVATLRNTFQREHADMARKTKAERRASLHHLKANVAGMRREFVEDLQGAHRAWFGPSQAERRAQAEAERRARAESERRRAEAEAQARARTAVAPEKRHPATLPPSKEERGPGKKKG